MRRLKMIPTIRNAFIVIALSGLLSACIESVPNESTPQQGNEIKAYTGPEPANDDVQGYRTNVWENLKANNRCGSCHGTDGQVPTFVRDDDVNLAYVNASTLISLTAPDESRLATKVAEGHNCWLDSNAACEAVIIAYIEAWASGTSTGGSTEIELEAPEIKDVGQSRNFPDTVPAEFSNAHTLLTTYCSGCHVDTANTPQAPYFADPNAQTAYEAAKEKINLDVPANSRLVVKLPTELHNCWDTGSGVDCGESAELMLDALTLMSDAIPLTTIDPALVTSKALNLTDGIIASGGSRDNSNVIAFYEFKTGNGTTLFDTSGVEPGMHLSLHGTEEVDYKWVGGWGIEFIGGRAQASTSASTKLHERILATGEYSIEAWVVPGNVNQENKPIISYSGGAEARNFGFGQHIYSYELKHRSSTTDSAGEPPLTTSDEDEDLQASQQHVVMTYDPIDGRKIYVNGEFTDDIDETVTGSLSSWDDTFAFVLGSEAGGGNPWAGKLRLVAVYNQALEEEQITRNFEAGVGEKFFLLFDISDQISIDESYIMFEVSQFDSYSYLFNQPMFINLDPDVVMADFSLAGLRLGINGQEAVVGQAFRNLDLTVSESNFVSDDRFTYPVQVLSNLGTIIALDKGVSQDEFFLTFAQLGGNSNVYVEQDCVPITDCPASFTPSDDVSDIGLRTFEEIDATMSSLTGVERTQAAVRNTYLTIQQQLPVNTSMDTFSSSHQMGIAQLAIEYCSAMVDDTDLRDNYFPDFTFTDSAGSAFDTATERDNISDPLIAGMLGTGIATNPSETYVETQLHSLMTNLSTCTGCNTTDRTLAVVKAACAATLGSAAMLVQ